MAILFFSPKQFDKVLKVTVQKTGKLGFSNGAAEAMSITGTTYFRFGKDDSTEYDLILVKLQGPSDEGYRAIKSGNYYSLATTSLFEYLKYDFKKENIFFDVKRASHLDAEAGGEAYTMTKRASKGRRAASKKVSPSPSKGDIPFEYGDEVEK